MPLSTYLANNLVNNAVAGINYGPPGNVYLALYTNNDSTGELSGSGYSRQLISMGTATNGVSSNTSAVSFTATANWSTIRSVAIVDATSSGNQLFVQKIAPRNVRNGDTLTFEIGKIQVSLT
jgi:hypothetical protein